VLVGWYVIVDVTLGIGLSNYSRRKARDNNPTSDFVSEWLLVLPPIVELPLQQIEYNTCQPFVLDCSSNHGSLVESPPLVNQDAFPNAVCFALRSTDIGQREKRACVIGVQTTSRAHGQWGCIC
jgi:hypothetical protein